MAVLTAGVRASPWEALESLVDQARWADDARLTVPWGEAFDPGGTGPRIGYGPRLVLEEVWFGTDASEKARIALPACVTFDGRWVGVTARAPLPAAVIAAEVLGPRGRLFLRFALADPPHDARWFRTGLLTLTDTARVELSRYAVFEKVDHGRPHPGFSG